MSGCRSPPRTRTAQSEPRRGCGTSPPQRSSHGIHYQLRSGIWAHRPSHDPPTPHVQDHAHLTAPLPQLLPLRGRKPVAPKPRIQLRSPLGIVGSSPRLLPPVSGCPRNRRRSKPRQVGRLRFRPGKSRMCAERLGEASSRPLRTAESKGGVGAARPSAPCRVGLGYSWTAEVGRL